jgi:hypothetical protein
MELKGATKELTENKKENSQKAEDLKQAASQAGLGPGRPTPEFYLTKNGLKQIQSIINEMPTRFGFPLMQIIEQNITPTNK